MRRLAAFIHFKLWNCYLRIFYELLLFACYKCPYVLKKCWI